MLVNPAYLAAHWVEVVELSLLCGRRQRQSSLRPRRSCSLTLRGPASSSRPVSAEIGEFSFIVGQAGLGLGVLDAVAVLADPGRRARLDHRQPADVPVDRTSRTLAAEDACALEGNRPPRPDGSGAACRPARPRGHRRLGTRRPAHRRRAAGRLQVPRLVVETNPGIADRLQAAGVDTLFGDAANSEMLEHAGLNRARALVVTVPDERTVRSSSPRRVASRPTSTSSRGPRRAKVRGRSRRWGRTRRCCRRWKEACRYSAARC